MNRKFWLDCIFATLFIFGLMWIFDNVSEFQIFDAFDPIGEALDDMEMSDIAFSRLRNDPAVDTNIVLVNIGLESRATIARQLEIISKYNPKVIGIDAFFDFPKPDTLGDLMLANAIANAPNVVMVTKLLQSDSLESIALGEEKYDTLRRSWPALRGSAYEGFANLETEAANQEDVKTCRRFPPMRYLLNGTEQMAFSVKVAQLYDSAKAEEIIRRDNDWEVINYRGNIVDFFGSTNYPNMFYALDVEDVLNENFTPGLIKGKIIIFGYLGRNFLDTSWEDKFFTPLNQKYAGKANPDMYGAVVHANALSMILNEDYVNVLDDKEHVSGMALAVLFCFLNVILFSLIYRRMPRWYDGITKIIQLFEILIIMFIMIEVFAIYSFKLNLTVTLIAIALTGDSLEVFYGVVKNIFNKERRRQLFTIQKDRV
jgi:CHASE2 domain-containing sensor protein